MDARENFRGAGLMMVAMAAFTVNDVCIKSLAGELPLMQAIFLRGLLSSFLMFLVARRMGAIRMRFPRRDWGLIALRCAAIFMQWSIAKRLTCSVIGPRSAT